MAITNADGSIYLTTQVDTSGIKRGMNSIKGVVSKFGAMVGVAFGVSALVNFGKAAINLASGLQEVQNVVDVAFGDMAYKAEEFAKSAIENFGISELSAKRTASTYMAMGKGMGIAEAEAADMAITMAGLTADIASFYNMSQERADVILKSVYTGETETLKQLGIVMTEVNLQNFAMSKGITKNLSAMTQQEKTMLRYQFVLEQTKLAQGDFIRTQDSWANQTRILSERWKEMQTIFGDAFMMLGTLVLPTINKVVDGLTEVAKVARTAAQYIYKMFTGKDFKEAPETEKEVADNIGDQVENQEALNKEMKKTLAGFDDLQILSSGIADNTEEMGGNVETPELPTINAPTIEGEEEQGEIPAFLKGFLNFVKGIKSAFQDNFIPNAQKLFDVFDKLLGWLTIKTASGWTALFDAIAGGIAGVVAVKITASAISGIKDLATGIGMLLAAAISHPVATLTGITVALGAFMALSDAKSPASQIAKDFEAIARDAEKATQKVQDFIDTSKNKFANIETNYEALTVIADKYYDLSQKATFSDEDKHLLDYYYSFLTDNGVDLKNKIDEITKAYKGTREELQKSLELTLKRLAVEAASEEITAAYKVKFDALQDIEEAQNKINELAPKIEEAQAKIEKVRNTDYGGGNIGFYNFSIALSNAERELNKLTKSRDEAIKSIETATAKVDEVDTLIEKYSNIIATGGENYVKGVVDGMNEINDTKVDPDFKPLMDNLDTALGKITSIGQGLAALRQAMTSGGKGSLLDFPLRVPALATGAVLPANKPFLAMVGDQKHGTNIEAPAQLIKQMVVEAMTEMGGNMGGGNTEVVLEIDGREFGRAVVEQGNRENRRIGTRLVNR